MYAEVVRSPTTPPPTYTVAFTLPSIPVHQSPLVRGEEPRAQGRRQQGQAVCWFGRGCRNQNCRFWHGEPPVSGGVPLNGGPGPMRKVCWFGVQCTRPICPYGHGDPGWEKGEAPEGNRHSSPGEKGSPPRGTPNGPPRGRGRAPAGRGGRGAPQREGGDSFLKSRARPGGEAERVCGEQAAYGQGLQDCHGAPGGGENHLRMSTIAGSMGRPARPQDMQTLLPHARQFATPPTPLELGLRK